MGNAFNRSRKACRNSIRRALAIFNNCYQNFGIMNAATMSSMAS
jgi:hypothetical protein